ncbi:gamma-glutamyl phosphate reductase [Multifurca ochricompacta]|uniref:glutamate-5-semialdehyde dehydrogenase n=1 Tax=Multifurca ochricompacta TaxID=376703 RepID=A0AAD4M948_9AGAM|nr:gamma-glutamyl phosphate reductase [Multifurca ochricompacta]
MSTSASAEAIAQIAKAAFETSQLVNSADRTRALHEIRKELEANKVSILRANGEDMTNAEAEAVAGRLSSSLVNRLDLRTGEKWDTMLQGVTDIAALQDPTGVVSYARELHNDLELYRVSCPIGVLLVIFEARPEVIVNIAALALKSGNAAILKGGKESARTTAELTRTIQTALARTALPGTFIQTVETRAEVAALLAQDRYIDLVIPRGSNELDSVMGHADGLCTIYLDESADRDKARRLVVDAKTDYPAGCNAVETLLVHESLLQTIWLDVANALLAANVKLLCDEPTIAALISPASHGGSPLTTTVIPKLTTHVSPATPKAYDTEHLSLTLAVRAVPSLAVAIAHINEHGSHHTDCIVTESAAAGSTFVRGVDSAGVFINASTRFADGFRYGFGAEVGISTGRIHARGPVGLEGLVTYKYVLRSKGEEGHIVGEFGRGPGKKQYTHQPIQRNELPF